MKIFYKVTKVNEDTNCQFSSDEDFQKHDGDLKSLFADLRKEYGKPSKMYQDFKDKTAHIGYTFSKTARYEDTNETYKQTAWVTLYQAPVKGAYLVLNK